MGLHPRRHSRLCLHLCVFVLVHTSKWRASIMAQVYIICYIWFMYIHEHMYWNMYTYMDRFDGSCIGLHELLVVRPLQHTQVLYRHTYMCMWVCILTYVCNIYICICTYIYKHIYVYVHVYIYIYIHMHIYVGIYFYIFICIYTYM